MRESIVHKPARAAKRTKKVLLMCAVDFTVLHFLLPLARALEHRGCQVTICCSRGPHFDDIRSAGFDIRENPVARSMNPLSHLASLWQTWRFLRRERFDVIHVHTPIAALIGRVAARIAGVPVKIYTAHGFYFHDEMPPPQRALHITLEKVGARCGDFIMTVSREDERTAIALGICPPDRIETIYNGVDTERFNPAHFSDKARADIRQRLGIARDAPVIGIIGRIVREKGFIEFFEAARSILLKHPRARFLVVGSTLPSDHDMGESSITRHLESLGIRESCILTGMADDTAPMLAAMDVFCLPSYREGMPVSLLEAMSMELPAVATNIRGCREEITDGDTGLLVPTRDARSLADSVTWLLDNPEQAHAMGQRARNRVLRHFDIHDVLDHQLRIYEQLMA